MKEFNDYDRKYPNLVMDILDYFKIESGIDIDKKSILTLQAQVSSFMAVLLRRGTV